MLGRTLGVPLFQEQVIKLAMVAAGFSPGEADQLRRSMAAWKRNGGLQRFEQKLVEGMRERGYSERFARQIYKQIEGFGEYGFPESHAASFALLVYVSAWLKCHAPAAFTAALLNSQPLGFYAPAQLVQDARRHGVEVRPVDVGASAWDCTLETTLTGQLALRLGLRRVKGLSKSGAERLVEARTTEAFMDVQDLMRRAELNRRDLEALAAADALVNLAGQRHQAYWAVLGIEAPTPLLAATTVNEASPLLRRPTEGEAIVADYGSLGLSLRRHPLALLRPRLERMAFVTGREGSVSRARRDRPRRRFGDHPPASRDRDRGGVRHTRGRDRLPQSHRLEQLGGQATKRASGLTPPRRHRRGATRGGGGARARPPTRGPYASAGALEHAIEGFSLGPSGAKPTTRSNLWMSE